MALAAARYYPSSRFLSAFLPVALSCLRPRTSTAPKQSWRQSPVFEAASLFPVAIGSGIASTFQDIWESVLRAVPKKKTTHSKKRHRQLAGKALQDVTSLNKCPGCGRQKRSHALCPYCVQTIRQYWGTNWKPTPELEAEKKEQKENREQEEKSRKHAKEMKWWPTKPADSGD